MMKSFRPSDSVKLISPSVLTHWFWCLNSSFTHPSSLQYASHVCNIHLDQTDHMKHAYSPVVITQELYCECGRLSHTRIVHEWLSCRLQQHLLCPVIDRFWQCHRRSVLAGIANQSVIACGDGRCDSPGFSAKLLVYALMEHSSSKIFHLEFVDKREVAGHSPNMEKLAFKRTMTAVIRDGVKVVEVVTDASSVICKLMSECSFFFFCYVCVNTR